MERMDITETMLSRLKAEIPLNSRFAGDRPEDFRVAIREEGTERRYDLQAWTVRAGRGGAWESVVAWPVRNNIQAQRTERNRLSAQIGRIVGEADEGHAGP